MNPLHPSRVGAAALASLLLASCGGGSGSSSTPGQTGSPTTLNIKIAGTSPQSKLRQLRSKHVQPKYVSVATEGIAVYAYPSNQGPPSNPTAVADVSASSANCTVDSDGSGDRVCAVPVSVPAGSDDFLVDAYDKPPSGGKPAGNLMEVGTALDVTITPGQPNNVNLTFDGVIASMAIAPLLMVSQDDQVQHTYPFAVNTFDADNYVIIDTTPFENPLSIAVKNDPNSTLAIIPPAAGTDPRLYTFTYNGMVVTDAQIVASATNVPSASADFTSMITTPQKLTIAKGKTGTITSQLAVPAGTNSQGPFSANTNNATNCSVNGSSGTVQVQPSSPGAAVTFTIKALAGTGCGVAIISPGPIYALEVIQVTID